MYGFQEEHAQEALKQFDLILASIQQTEWSDRGIPLMMDWAKQTKFFNKLHHSVLRSLLMKELDRRLPKKELDTEKQLGIAVRKIEKVGDLFSFTTDQGNFSIAGEDLVSQSIFRKKAIASLGVYVSQLNRNDWELTLALWLSCAKKDTTDDSEEEQIKDFLSQFLDQALEEDVTYLKKAVPVFFEETYNFRLNDFMKFLRKECDAKLSRPQIISYLHNAGF